MLFVNKKYESLHKILNESVNSCEVTNEEVIEEAAPKFSTNEEIWKYFQEHIGKISGSPAFIKFGRGANIGYIYNAGLVSEGDEIPDGVKFLIKGGSSPSDKYTVHYIEPPKKDPISTESELLALFKNTIIENNNGNIVATDKKDSSKSIRFKVKKTSAVVKAGVYKWEPSPEDWEIVISFAYNRNYAKEYSVTEKTATDEAAKRDNDNMLFVAGGSSRSAGNINRILGFYNDNKKNIDGIVGNLHKQAPGMNAIKKLQTAEVSLSNEWGIFGGTDKTPKTDVISDDGKYKMSLKKVGGSQLMSGVRGEANATLRCVYKRLVDKYTKALVKKATTFARNCEKQLDNIFNNKNMTWSANMMFKEKDLEEKAKQMNKELQSKIRDLLKDDEFKAAVVEEAITGEIKFGGSDSLACASHIFIWDPKGKSQLWDAKDYADKHTSIVKVEVDFKSSDNKKSTVLRLASNSKIEDVIDSVK